jgi:hypothetical protein
VTLTDDANHSQKVNRLLSRFKSVRPAGPNRWRCRRPGSDAHNVAVALSDNGRILIHDHAMRSPAELLAELGMTLADLAPERAALDRPQSPQERREARRALSLTSVESAARVIGARAVVLQAAAAMLAEGHALSPEDRDRLSEAHEAIEAALMVLSAEVRP